jgi:uncharacterized UBP type Zn finger protein
VIQIKQKITLNVDRDIYYEIQTRKMIDHNFSVSNFLNDSLKALFSVNVSDTEETKIKEELEDTKKQILDMQSQEKLLQAKLFHIIENKKRSKEKEFQELLRVTDSLDASGMMHQAFSGDGR